jgi:hypothetical protein
MDTQECEKESLDALDMLDGKNMEDLFIISEILQPYDVE